MSGALLDTHALYWAVSGGSRLAPKAVSLLAESQIEKRLFISPITAWEMSLAKQKRFNAPSFGGLSVEQWFRRTKETLLVRVISVNQPIAIAAARVATDTGHRDPADCYIIATAKVRKIPVITRDAMILRIAASGYVDAIPC